MNLLASLEEQLEPYGIKLRGVVHFGADEGPSMGGAGFARSVVLLGNVGGSIWQPFNDWREGAVDRGGSDPLDNWSKSVIGPVADRFAAAAYFPSDKPWWPFQQWAMKAEGLQASPLGLLIHPEYGLWHGYRGALGFAEILEGDHSLAETFSCSSCHGRPCLSACPVDAVSLALFDIGACRSFLSKPEGQSGCMNKGCAARNACPVGAAYRYPEAQLAFHMQALGI